MDYKLLFGAILGAFASLIFAIIYNQYKLCKFGCNYLRQLKGKYNIKLKYGGTDKITQSEILSYSGKTIKFKMTHSEYDDATGEVTFSSNRYGSGWYEYSDSVRHGFIEMVNMPSGRVAVMTKYLDKDNNQIIRNYLWEKDQNK